MKTFLPWLIIVLLLAYIFWPSKPLDTSETDRKIAQRDSMIWILKDQADKDSIRRERERLEFMFKEVEYENRLETFRNDVARLKANPRVIEVRQREPEIDSLILAQDSVILYQQEQLTLSSEYISTLQSDIGKITENFMERLSLQQDNIADQKEVIDSQRKQLRKERRAKRLAKILVPVAAIAGFLIGTQ